MRVLPDSKSSSGQHKAAFGPKALALGAGALWLLAVLAYCLLSGTDGGVLAPLLAAIAPLVPLYLAASAQAQVAELASLRQEAAQLRRALAEEQAKATAPRVADPRAAPPRPVAKAVKAAPAREATQQQQSLALDTPEAKPLSHADLIRALHFPESGEDHARIQALRLALQNPEIAKLIRSAQDMLTLLSQEGVFMDHLVAGTTDPALWRRFAAGERGQEVAAIGEISDAIALQRTAQRLHEDPVFRDAAHHFLRGYDRLLQGLLPEISEADLAQLAQTRTARAFALCARAIGVFE